MNTVKIFPQTRGDSRPRLSGEHSERQTPRPRAPAPHNFYRFDSEP